MDGIVLKTTDLTKKYNNKAVVDNLNIEIKHLSMLHDKISAIESFAIAYITYYNDILPSLSVQR